MACITKRRDRWIIDFYDQHGKRRWITLPEGTTKGRAKEELRAIEDQVNRKMFLPSAKVLLFSEVAREWIEPKKLKLRETTWEVYEGHVRNHFQDLDRLKINRVTIATVEKFITDRQARRMNINTLRKVLVNLGQILNYAVRHNYIDHNPLREAERPGDHVQRNEAQDEERIKILNPVQINAFMSQVKDQKYRMLFMLAIFTGARQGSYWDLNGATSTGKIGKFTFSVPLTRAGSLPPRPRPQIGRSILAPRP
jgi:hypothetical protein